METMNVGVHPDLCREVSQSKFKNFRKYVKEKNISKLVVIGLVQKYPLWLWSQALQGTKVTWFDLSGNYITDEIAADVAKNLLGSQVEVLEMNRNKIGPQGAANAVKNLQGSKVKTFNIERNNIGIKGAVNIVKNIPGTQIISLGLGSNNIGYEDVNEIVKQLRDIQLSRIGLDTNHLSEGAVEIAKNLKGSSVKTLILHSNEIRSQGASNTVKNLQGTQVVYLDLRFNQIKDQGALDIANNLDGTQLLNINLFGNLISPLIQQFFNKKLARHRQNLIYTPYYALCLQFLPQEEKRKHFNLGVENLCAGKQLEYAGGIIANMPHMAIAAKIVEYLPHVKIGKSSQEKMTEYAKVAQQYHSKGLRIEERKDAILFQYRRSENKNATLEHNRSISKSFVSISITDVHSKAKPN